MIPYRLVFEDAVANLKAIWQCTQKLQGGDQEFLSSDGTRGGIFESWAAQPSRLAAALPSTVPFPYVLEFVHEHQHEVEFIVLNEAVTQQVLGAWCDDPSLIWLRSIPIHLGKEALSKYPFYSHNIDSANSTKLSSLIKIPPQSLPEKCQPMEMILTDCELTRRAWSKVVPLPSPLTFTGVVTKGFQRGGSLLGCPTANISCADQSMDLKTLRDEIILFGTYSAEAIMDGVKYAAVASLGMNPVFEGTVPTLEVHLFSLFEENFYGATVTVKLTGFLRSESSFENLKDLVFAIQMDCEVQNSISKRALENDDHFFIDKSTEAAHKSS